ADCLGNCDVKSLCYHLRINSSTQQPTQHRRCWVGTSCLLTTACTRENKAGAVSEWFKEHAWKACRRVTVTWVRIPPAPPFVTITFHYRSSGSAVRTSIDSSLFI